MTLTSGEELDQMFGELMGVVAKRQLPINLSYHMLITCFSRLAQALGLSIEQIISDVEIIYKSLPAPIEESDESN